MVEKMYCIIERPLTTQKVTLTRLFFSNRPEINAVCHWAVSIDSTRISYPQSPRYGDNFGAKKKKKNQIESSLTFNHRTDRLEKSKSTGRKKRGRLDRLERGKTKNEKKNEKQTNPTEPVQPRVTAQRGTRAADGRGARATRDRPSSSSSPRNRRETTTIIIHTAGGTLHAAIAYCCCHCYILYDLPPPLP